MVSVFWKCEFSLGILENVRFALAAKNFSFRISFLTYKIHLLIFEIEKSASFLKNHINRSMSNNHLENTNGDDEWWLVHSICSRDELITVYIHFNVQS